MTKLKELESNVKYYCNKYPAIFSKAHDCFIVDIKGKKYIDFFSGAGALNYGHNNQIIKKALIEYISQDGITHSLDMFTSAKEAFVDNFYNTILKPRDMNYKFQFCGPTGTNAVEAALKLARKVTKRQNVVSFTGSFHGVSLGSLSVSASKSKRLSSGVSLNNTVFMPYEDFFTEKVDTLSLINQFLTNPSSGIEPPAAIILETIQAEGGINTASKNWLVGISEIAKKIGALLIVDDIQVGCGRTGQFFSFENVIKPDIICLSKSLSGFGLPLSLVLLNPDIDLWLPGEHNGTFRGNNHAFITASAALDFWKDKNFENLLHQKSCLLEQLLLEKLYDHHLVKSCRGRGLIRGMEFNDSKIAEKIILKSFEKGLIIESCGSYNHIIKLLPPIIIDDRILREGLEILYSVINEIG
ncbi:MAG: diaminobutyrate--2-oxoglutarate transaminase [Arcobacter sp.]|nr:diaminobutyrate--2-oxoglutarate transaminase [Arcobacter sp.]